MSRFSRILVSAICFACLLGCDSSSISSRMGDGFSVGNGPSADESFQPRSTPSDFQSGGDSDAERAFENPEPLSPMNDVNASGDSDKDSGSSDENSIPAEIFDGLFHLFGTGDFHQNWSGQFNEKWFKGLSEDEKSSVWYYIVPTGDIFVWEPESGKNLRGEAKGNVGQRYYTHTDELLYAAPVHQPEGYDRKTFLTWLDAEYQFLSVQQGESFNWSGNNEKWILSERGGKQQWFFVRPNGQLWKWYAPSGKRLGGDYYADVGVDVYRDLTKLTEASLDSAGCNKEDLNCLDEKFEFSTFGQRNWSGQFDEVWILGADGWYFLLPNHKLYRWDPESGKSLRGQLIVKDLYAAVHADPALLVDAYQR